MADRLPDQLLDLIVRFTQSLGDASIRIASPSTTSTLSLKQLIRSNLPPTYSNRRLRLIYAGKVLADKDALSTSLNLAAQGRQRAEDKPAGRKGKQPVRDGTSSPAALKLYVHCSIGDALSAKDLTDEAAAASSADEALKAPQPASPSNTTSTDASGRRVEAAGAGGSGASTTAPAGPRGFDRLLTTGFSPAEVAALRSQYLNILAHTHTPDNMPSGAALLRLEDQWLDNDSSAGSGPGTLSTDGGAGGGEGADTWGADDGRALDDFLWGNVTGFFWPFGAIVWGFREEGVWTRRRQIAVFTGLLINLVFGFARLTS